jgi:hypothetical protein
MHFSRLTSDESGCFSGFADQLVRTTGIFRTIKAVTIEHIFGFTFDRKLYVTAETGAMVQS